MFEQKQNNPMLNTQEEIAKLNRSKQRQSSVVPEGAGAADVDMIVENEAAESQVGVETPSKKRNRAEFEKSQQQMAEQLMKEEKSEQKDHDESM